VRLVSFARYVRWRRMLRGVKDEVIIFCPWSVLRLITGCSLTSSPLRVIRPNSVAARIYDFIAVEVRWGRRNSDVLHLVSPKAMPVAFSVYRCFFSATFLHNSSKVLMLRNPFFSYRSSLLWRSQINFPEGNEWSVANKGYKNETMKTSNGASVVSSPRTVSSGTLQRKLFRTACQHGMPFAVARLRPYLLLQK